MAVEFVERLTEPYNIENLRERHAALQASLNADPNNDPVLQERNQVVTDMTNWTNLETVRAQHKQALENWALNAANLAAIGKSKPMPTLTDAWKALFHGEEPPAPVQAESDALAVENASVAKTAGLLAI
jgi:hypothetical protein